ncbi:tripartite tricarboxylate transporter TctB family protein [Nocardioides sp. LHG3406-4]|uniref:tripartite tricarboxylate transporter TctB family protein n=1 Tax=Nocardioides sp. LHG3406-4 TaxID=2804575 RepID=UPI003CEDA149
MPTSEVQVLESDRRVNALGDLLVTILVAAALAVYAQHSSQLHGTARTLPLIASVFGLALAIAQIVIDIRALRAPLQPTPPTVAAAPSGIGSPIDDGPEDYRPPDVPTGTETLRALGQIVVLTVLIFGVGLLIASTLMLAYFLIVKTELRLWKSLLWIAVFVVASHFFFVNLMALSPFAGQVL